LLKFPEAAYAELAEAYHKFDEGVSRMTPESLIGRTIIVRIEPPTEYPIVADADFEIDKNFKESTARSCLMNPKLYMLKPLTQADPKDCE
jgi:hypothetical protein